MGKKKKLSNEELWMLFNTQYIQNNGLTQKRLAKLTSMYKLLSKGLKTPIDAATKDDLVDFVDRLNSGQIKRENGEPYKGNTKSDIKKFLRMLYKWRRGDGVTFPPEIAWLKTRIAKDEKPTPEAILTQTDAVRLARSFTQAEYRALVLLLYDSGFRIDEMMSVQKQDLSWEEFEPGKWCWWISCNRSKTYTRKVDVQLFTDEISAFANSTYYKSLNDTDLIWPVTYTAIAKNLKKHGKEVLNRPEIHPHLFRHSSATLYAEIYDGNVINLSQRFGWSYTASEMQVYIRKSKGMKRLSANKGYENQVIKLNQRIGELEGEMQDMKKAFKIIFTKKATFEKAKDIYKKKITN